MAIVAMQKVAVSVHHSVKEAVLDALYSAGVLQIQQASGGDVIDHTDVNFRAADVEYAINLLEAAADKPTLQAASHSFGDADIVATTNKTDVLGIVDTLRKLEAADTEAQGTIKEADALLSTLTPWENLPGSLADLTKGTNVRFMVGTIPADQVAALTDAIHADFTAAELTIVSQNKESAAVSAIILTNQAADFEAMATSLGWTNVNLPESNSTAKQLVEETNMKLLQAEKVLEESATKRTELSAELPALMQVRTFMHWLSDKQDAREAMSSTSSTGTLFGWMPSKEVEKLEVTLQKIDPAVAVFKVKPDEGEEPPIKIWNSKWIRPFHSVTELYGLPTKNDMDPTFALSPFFILYFALCLTDAGYGLIIALATGLLLLKTRKSIDEAELVWLLFMGGIVTFLVGILFGGWFGFQPEQAPAWLVKEGSEGLLFKGQIWHLGKQSGITFLQNLSLFFGVLQVFFGIFLAGYHKWVHNQKTAALWQDFTSHLLLGTVIFYAAAPADLKSIALWTLYASIALLVWGKGYGNKWYLRPLFGFLGLLDFAMSLMSNILSYLRIMALGLVTGALALAVNQMAVQIGSLLPGVLAIPVIILLFVGGHTISIALNALGSFIHSARLQFIEFFSQFFEGGGRGFEPFARRSS